MKRVGWVGALLAAIGILGAIHPNVAAQQVDAAAVSGELVVKFVEGASEKQQDQAVRARGGEVAERIPELGVAVARFKQPKGADASRSAELAEALESDIVIEYAEPNYIVRATQAPVVPATPDDVSAAQAGRRRFIPQVLGLPVLLPDDPSTSQQWAWNTIGAYRGWALGTGAPQVAIAILDTGIDGGHPDLASKLVAGYDFIDNDAIPQEGPSGHGTHVAGTAAGITNNAVGVAGTCPNCSIMPVRVLDDEGNGSVSEVVAGINFAVENGAKVLNMSFSGAGPSKILEDTINSAWARGAVLVCAAGNDGTTSTLEAYPAAASNCIAVGATDRSDAKPRWSNYGTWVDIAAPGLSILSTVQGGSYGTKSGTSMSSPHVAGAAGLLASKGLTNAQIRERLEATADKIPGTGVYWNAGRLNIEAAMQ